MPVLERFSRLSVALCRVMMAPRLAPNGAVLELVAEGEYEISLGLGLISPKEVPGRQHRWRGRAPRRPGSAAGCTRLSGSHLSCTGPRCARGCLRKRGAHGHDT